MRADLQGKSLVKKVAQAETHSECHLKTLFKKAVNQKCETRIDDWIEKWERLDWKWWKEDVSELQGETNQLTAQRTQLVWHKNNSDKKKKERQMYSDYLSPHLLLYTPPVLTMHIIYIYTPPVPPSFHGAYSMINQLSPWQSACVTRLALGPRLSGISHGNMDTDRKWNLLLQFSPFCRLHIPHWSFNGKWWWKWWMTQVNTCR